LDALQFRASQADALVEEANVAFLMNMLLFEERDVAAGHLKRTRTMDEVLELVRANTSALSFQKAYGEEAPATSNKCPFLPSGDDNAANPSSAIPFPCLCFHDPRSALVQHPRKSIGSLLAIFGLGVSAWRFPRTTGCGVFGSIFVLAHSKTVRAHSPKWF